MKDITIEDFEKSVYPVISDVLSVGEAYRVDAGKAGAVVVIEEPHYQMMRDALEAVLSLSSSSVEATEDGGFIVRPKE